MVNKLLKVLAFLSRDRRILLHARSLQLFARVYPGLPRSGPEVTCVALALSVKCCSSLTLPGIDEVVKLQLVNRTAPGQHFVQAFTAHPVGVNTVLLIIQTFEILKPVSTFASGHQCRNRRATAVHSPSPTHQPLPPDCMTPGPRPQAYQHECAREINQGVRYEAAQSVQYQIALDCICNQTPDLPMDHRLPHSSWVRGTHTGPSS